MFRLYSYRLIILRINQCIFVNITNNHFLLRCETDVRRGCTEMLHDVILVQSESPPPLSQPGKTTIGLNSLYSQPSEGERGLTMLYIFRKILTIQ